MLRQLALFLVLCLAALRMLFDVPVPWFWVLAPVWLPLVLISCTVGGVMLFTLYVMRE